MQQRPAPIALPEPLPSGLLPDLLQRGNLLLCMDYDGTLSEITNQPSEARLVAGIADSLLALARCRSKIAIAIVSGRDLDTLRQLLGIHFEAWLIGTHGLEMLDREGQRLLAPGSSDYAKEVKLLDQWIDRENLAAKPGLVIENKAGLAVALHYRMAEASAAASVRQKVREFAEGHCPDLKMIQGKMVDEFVPRGIGGKGYAVQWLMSAMKEPASIAYFGDDTTDEDAFFELRDKGVTVLVGPCRLSWASYCVDGPSAVAGLLRELAMALETSAP